MSRDTTGSGWAGLLAEPELAGTLEAELFGLLAAEGRLRRAARELAGEEHGEGAHVDESEAPVARARLAAQDRRPGGVARTYGDGRYRLRLRQGEEGRELEQLEGPPGATVVLDGAHHPVQPGQVVRLGAGELPERLEILDLRGRVRVLGGE